MTNYNFFSCEESKLENKGSMKLSDKYSTQISIFLDWIEVIFTSHDPQSIKVLLSSPKKKKKNQGFQKAILYFLAALVN